VTSSSPNASAISAISASVICWFFLSSSRPRLVANFFAARRPSRLGLSSPSSRRSGISMKSFVLQSSIRTITSWATSTRRRVR
jgi:hypothetical protein